MFTVAALTCLGCKGPVKVYPVRKDIVETVYASGKIIPGEEYNLFALSNGKVVAKLVKDGDTVKKGQLLYIISNEAASEKYNAALKNYSNAELNLSDRSPLLNDLRLSMQNAAIKFTNDSLQYHRWKNLWDRDIGSRNNLDNLYSAYQLSLSQKKSAEEKYFSATNDIRLSYANARSQLATARNELNDYFIRSEADGVVYQTFKEEGESVRNNEIVALMGKKGQRVIRLAVDQQDINRIRKGQTVLLQTDVTGKTIYEAFVSRIYPTMNEADQTFRVDALFRETPGHPFIHGSLEANIVVRKKEQALTLPRDALIGKDSILLTQNGKRRKAGIQIGIVTLDQVEILSGVDERTPVILTTEK
jgi:HlyD family secretion protein